MYERTVAYIDYFENDIRIKNIGFMKWESDGKNHQIQMKITGLYKSDTIEVAIKDGSNKILSYVKIREGQGELKEKYYGQAIGMEGVALNEIEYLVLRISGKRYGIVRWNRKKHMISAQKDETIVEKRVELDQVETAQPISVQPISVQPISVQSTSVQSTSVQSTSVPPATVQKQLYEDKWQQLCHTYQVIHPFRQKEDYLSITPEDFIIFREPYQKLVHNSFLIHGYYNYRHIILGKMIKSNQEIYYLGVPGVYYEREKMAAEVFGFEGFESVEEEITNGAFGYYLRKVEL